MNELKRSDKVEAFFLKATPEAMITMHEIRDAVLKLPIEITEDVKWGVPCYSHGGLLFGMGNFKKHIGLNFFQGASLKDSFGVFDDDSGAIMRSIRIPHGTKPNLEAIQDLVLQAAENNGKGMKAGASKNAKVLDIPAWFSDALSAYPDVFQHFDELSYSHKKEYVEYVTSAKKEETRQARLQKSIELMRKGSGLNDRYKKS